jgi:4-hydroxyproline epimerase
MQFIDSHTEGEPTRVIVAGGPDLGGGTVAQQLQTLSAEHDSLRRTTILEPRGSDAVVGALLCPPSHADCAAGVIFFNNSGYLGMCGHGAIGVAVTLAHLGQVELGKLKLETPVGVVGVELHSANEATIENVPSYRYRQAVPVEVPQVGAITGDIAWGGNWFFLVSDAPKPLTLAHERELTDIATRIKTALLDQDIRGEDGGEIDHVEFFSAPQNPDHHSRNFVLCPGNAYDRSPCGTGTSAKLACLAADGKLQPGEAWIQESVIGSRFITQYRASDNGHIIPSITGRAYLCSEGRLIQQADDPFACGIGAD